MIRGLLGRVAKLEKAKPTAPALDWAVICGEKPPPDPDAEIAPGVGMTWAEASTPTPVTDPVADLVALLPPKPNPPSPPEEAEIVPPTPTPVLYPPGYPFPEPEGDE